MPLRVIRLIVIALCAGGIVGMIVASVAGNNNGWVVTFGLITAVSIVLLMAFSASARAAAAEPGRGADEELAERVEVRIHGLVETGADETAVRDLVRDAVRLGRSR
jgi:dipeptide/tripeptide permease